MEKKKLIKKILGKFSPKEAKMGFEEEHESNETIVD